MRARPGGEVGGARAGHPPAPSAIAVPVPVGLGPTPCVARGRLPCEVQFAERDSSWRLFNFKVNDSVLL
jgi:hypothetical protein